MRSIFSAILLGAMLLLNNGFTGVSCIEPLPDRGTAISAMGYSFPYNLKKPVETLKLQPELKEISGLSLSDYDNRIYGVQDEFGVLYQISKKSGKTKGRIKFYKDGDYEGVELVGKDAYVVKSSGTIYEVQKFNTDQQKTLKYNSFLGKGNDIEGLAYDRANNRLLMACKGYGHFQEDGDKMYKPIYAFSLEGKQVAEKPVFIIELEAVRTFLKAHKTEEEQLDDFDDFFKEKIKSLPFSPSAIAVHPLSGNIYVASSVGKMLMVLDSEGNILHIEKLKKKVHRQPEGMAFESDGTLYISNEGKDGTGSIHQFVPKGVE